MTAFQITHESTHGGAKGRYALTRDGVTAELIYTVLSAKNIIADHTEVPEALRGTGAGLALVAEMVNRARADGVKITPLCSFVDAMRKKHPEWQDVFAV